MPRLHGARLAGFRRGGAGAGAEDLHDQVQPRARPEGALSRRLLNWAKRVEERTKGGLKIEVFHCAQLGKEEDIIEQIRQGANIGQNTDSARMGNYVPGIAVMNGPYFAETLDDVAKLRKSPTVMEWQEDSPPSTASRSCASTGCRATGTSSPTSRSRRRTTSRPAHPHPAGADLAGVDPRARRRAGRDGFRRNVSGPAAAGDRRRRARLQQHSRAGASMRC